MRKLSQQDAEDNVNLVGLTLMSEYINSRSKCVFKCHCGNIFVSIAGCVTHGKRKSCGCTRKSYDHTKTGRKPKDITGLKFSRLLALTATNKKVGGSIVWVFKCDCGSTLEAPLNRVTCGNTKSCGCLNIELSTNRLYKMHKMQKGVNHPSYMGSKIDRTKRCLLEDDTWKKAVYKKYNYMCDKCGISNCVVHAHHLNSWKDYPEQRQDVENGVCLCGKCHTTFHRLYGYGGNTKEQYVKFKELNKSLASS